MAEAAKKQLPMLKEGEQAPGFSLPTDGGGAVKLSSLRGKKVVLYFYPKDDTPGCTQESKDFRDQKEDFDAADAAILGLSKDSPSSHDAFKEKYCLPFSLLSDESGSTVEAYGSWCEKSMFGKKYMGIDRSTFLIDRNGVVRKIWRKVKVEGHVKEVLAAAKKLP